MDCIYEMIVTEETDAWGNPYTGYGIEAWTATGERKSLHRVPDLFMSRQRCEQFVHMCNTEEVASFHLLEVIDNVLQR
ncbi:MAG: hypothetical protein IJC33_07720 [Clostridia bacterium]|nr:hypothetical protein [Clostridia bacterium]